MKFEEWLGSQGLSQSTVEKYSGAINGALTKWGRDSNIISNSISQVVDPDEFASLVELIEETETFIKRNARGNHMYSAALNKYAKYLDHLSVAKIESLSAESPIKQLEKIESDEAEIQPFLPDSEADARQRVLTEIVRRQGQPKFRAALIDAYEGRCAITHCPIRVVLEAAHVTPYLGVHTNAVSNGLLLRADIHTLWDLGLIALAPDTLIVCVCPSLPDESYRTLEGRKVFQPVDLADRLSPRSLQQQWELFRKNSLHR